MTLLKQFIKYEWMCKGIMSMAAIDLGLCYSYMTNVKYLWRIIWQS